MLQMAHTVFSIPRDLKVNHSGLLIHHHCVAKRILYELQMKALMSEEHSTMANIVVQHPSYHLD